MASQSLHPKAVISLPFRGGLQCLLWWIAPLWSLFGQVPFGQLIHGSALVAIFFGESWEQGHHVGVPENHPPYQGNYGVTQGNSSAFQVQSPYGSGHS